MRRKQLPVMRIAVIIPVYNVTRFLEEAIRSVALQDYPGQEIIVIDDGSAPEHADEIARICGHYPLALYRRPHLGQAAARDFGRAQTGAELIVFLDGDDILAPGALSYFAEAIGRAPGAVGVYARVVTIDEAGDTTSGLLPAPSWIASGREVLEFLLERKVPFCNGSICIRADALRSLSVDNHHLTVGEDWVLWCHLAHAGDILHAGDRVVLHRRRHGQNISSLRLENPELLMAAVRTIFSHPVFKEKMGEEKLLVLQEKALCRIHAALASAYAANAQPEQAMRHLQQITLPLSEISN